MAPAWASKKSLVNGPRRTRPASTVLTRLRLGHSLVDVKAVRPLARPVTLPELKARPELAEAYERGDDEAIADSDQRLVDGRGGVASALDGDLVADAQLALLDPRDLVARGVLEDEGLPEANRLAVDLVGPLALLVLDPEVIADRQQLLAHEKPLASGSIPPIPQEWHVPTI